MKFKWMEDKSRFLKVNLNYVGEYRKDKNNGHNGHNGHNKF